MPKKIPLDYKNAIRSSGFDIYSSIKVGDAQFWIPTRHLEKLLNQGLTGLDLSGLALRTRSKIVKSAVCDALGYPVPKSFKRTKPQFLGQQFDVYAQKSTNLQIWNEELSLTRRYAIIQISDQDIVLRVKVVNGQELTLLDTTGTITHKYQAALVVRADTRELVSAKDTPSILPHVHSGATFAKSVSPVDDPESSAKPN